MPARLPVRTSPRARERPSVRAVSIWSSLDPASASVDPGGSVTVVLRLRNTTDLVEEYRIAVGGEPAVWAQVEPQVVRLYPEASGTAEITFRPPRSPDATAGGHPFAVEVTPAEQPADKAVVEGHLTVTPFTDVRAELLPQIVRGRFRGKPKFAVDNLGNTRLVASLTGQDNTGQLGFDLHPANVQVEPGRAAWVDGRVRPGGITWFGRRQSHPYTVNVLRSGTEPVEVEGTYLQLAVLPGWLLGVLSVLVAGVVALVVAWFAFAPQFDTRAREVALPKHPRASESPSTSQTPTSAPTPGQSEQPQAQQPGQPSPGQSSQMVPKGPIGGPGEVGMCITVPDDNAQNGSPIQLSDCNEAAGQQWTIALDHTIRALGKCLDVNYGDGSVDVPKLMLWDCHGTDGQKWRTKSDGSIVNPESGRCVDTPEGNTADGTPLQIYDCNGQWPQQWNMPEGM